MTDNHFDFNETDSNVPRNVVIVNVHPNVIIIRDSAFLNYRSLQSIELPNTLTSIESNAFEACLCLTSINVPQSVTNIGSGAFSGCYALTRINIPSSIPSILDETFYQCQNLTAINIPSSVTSIGESAFDNCEALISIKLPVSLTSIGRFAFARTPLKAVTLPNSLVRIGSQAFYRCYSLALIAIAQPEISIGGGAFNRCDALERRQANGFNFHVDVDDWLRQRFAKLPLHQAFYGSSNNMTTALLEALIQQHGPMLNSIDAMLMTPLHVLCSSPTVTAEMIQALVTASPDTATARNVLQETPLMMYLKCRKAEYNAYHDDGQLRPMVELLELGVKHDILKVILIFYDENKLGERDASGLLPFMYAASLSQCELSIVYELMTRRFDLLIEVIELYQEEMVKIRNLANSISFIESEMFDC